MSKIRELRKAQKLTQAELAKLLDIDRTTVAQWEIGKNKPRVDTLLKLASIFKCNVDFLLRA